MDLQGDMLNLLAAIRVKFQVLHNVPADSSLYVHVLARFDQMRFFVMNNIAYS